MTRPTTPTRRRPFVAPAIALVILALLAAPPAAAQRRPLLPRHRGTAPLGSIHDIPNRVWVGETPFGKGDDWEPDIAADPNSPYVYVVTTRFGKPACSNCPYPAIVLKVSTNDGATWGPSSFLCKCQGRGWQYDPRIPVANDGTVDATFLQGWRTMFTTSTDHGQTWSAPVSVEHGFSWTDHGFPTISPNGQDVYVAFNHADSWVVSSRDGGQTWGTPIMTNPASESGHRYYYHFDGTVLADGSVNIAITSVSNHPYAQHQVRYYDLRSTDSGGTWQQVRVGTFKEQPPCQTPGCRHDHFAGLNSIASDANGTLVMAMAGTNVAGQGQRTFVSRSTDEGVNWSKPVPVSPTFAKGGRRVDAAFPWIAGTGNGSFRLWWMDNRNAWDRWNTWYRQSSDGGVSWTKTVRISDATSGAPYKHPGGFEGDYGDYGGISILDTGQTIAAWGEAFGYAGPGGTWINRQP